MNSHEKRRLQALLDYKVLDTPAESSYDDLTLLASQICNTPISLISLIDKNRQWFKSVIGLDVEETPRNISFCTHAIETNDMFIVNDALNHPKFKDNPLVVGAPHIRFYAGALLTDSQGYNLGTLCIIDVKPRDLTQDQISALNVLAKQVVHLFNLKKTNAQLAENFKELQKISQSLATHQESLVYNARLKSVGELASGLAHEINNPLAIISGKIATLKLKMQSAQLDNNYVSLALEAIDKSTFRIAKIIKSLREFANDSYGEKSSHPISKILEEVTTLATNKIKKSNIELNINLNGEDPNIYCNPSQISQILLNLINNSIDAIKNSNPKWIRIECTIQNNFLLIEVIDSGKGIPVEIRDRILFPFFTTKQVGHGSGLGLSVSKGLAEANGGNLSLNPACENTSFIVKLPVDQSKTFA